MPALEETTCSVPAASTPAAIAASPPGCTARCIAVGATASGEDTWVPSNVVVRSGTPPPRSTRVRKRTDRQACSASRTDSSP